MFIRVVAGGSLLLPDDVANQTIHVENSHNLAATAIVADQPLLLKNALDPWAKSTRSPLPGANVRHVQCIAISPDHRSLAWGDGGGNVFFSAIGRGPVVVVSDRTFNRTPLKPEEEWIFGVEAIQFREKGVLYWLDHWGTAWRAWPAPQNLTQAL